MTGERFVPRGITFCTRRIRLLTDEHHRLKENGGTAKQTAIDSEKHRRYPILTDLILLHDAPAIFVSHCPFYEVIATNRGMSVQAVQEPRCPRIHSLTHQLQHVIESRVVARCFLRVFGLVHSVTALASEAALAARYSSM